MARRYGTTELARRGDTIVGAVDAFRSLGISHAQAAAEIISALERCGMPRPEVIAALTARESERARERHDGMACAANGVTSDGRSYHYSAAHNGYVFDE